MPEALHADEGKGAPHAYRGGEPDSRSSGMARRIEAGAIDYCAALFEHRDISWLIQSVLLASQHAHVS